MNVAEQYIYKSYMTICYLESSIHRAGIASDLQDDINEVKAIYEKKLFPIMLAMEADKE